MICYGSSGNVAGAATKTIISVLATSTRRPRLKQVVIGCPDTPADMAAKFAIRRITSDGTGTGGTTFQADAADGAPICTIKVNYTVEPSYASGNIYEMSINQRGTLVWEPPDDEAGEISSALGSGNGVGIQMLSGPSSNYAISIAWEE